MDSAQTERMQILRIHLLKTVHQLFLLRCPSCPGESLWPRLGRDIDNSFVAAICQGISSFSPVYVPDSLLPASSLLLL